jgi:hypothetical protein
LREYGVGHPGRVGNLRVNVIQYGKGVFNRDSRDKPDASQRLVEKPKRLATNQCLLGIAE